jgi:fructosamine-3-kinase
VNTALPHPRADIYYWKCDRPAAFYGLSGPARERPPGELETALASALARHFGERIVLAPGSGQGNHLTFTARIGGHDTFIRVEDGPDGDDYMEVESHVLRSVARLGVPAPAVLQVDATRRDGPFAWQVLECIPFPDLNRHLKEGHLDLARIAPEIGAHIARWQSLALGTGYGPFSTELVRTTGELRGYHARYADYFQTRLDRHLAFLVENKFLTSAQVDDLQREIDTHAALLALPAACLVHKDLALWNILGTSDRIAAFIDFDDAVGGDPLDDISLLACFHDGATIGRVLAGYATVRPLPAGYRRRFWLHLLRNMIWKAVIRVGAGYFERTSGFFLVGAGASGADLRAFTLARLDTALRGLRTDAAPDTLP